MGVKIENGPGSSVAPARLAQRRIVVYRATCRACEESLPTPREARAHATAHGHLVYETKHCLLEPPE